MRCCCSAHEQGSRVPENVGENDQRQHQAAGHPRNQEQKGEHRCWKTKQCSSEQAREHVERPGTRDHDRDRERKAERPPEGQSQYHRFRRLRGSLSHQFRNRPLQRSGRAQITVKQPHQVVPVKRREILSGRLRSAKRFNALSGEPGVEFRLIHAEARRHPHECRAEKTSQSQRQCNLSHVPGEPRKHRMSGYDHTTSPVVFYFLPSLVRYSLS
jgi:hypothetical protein